MWKRSWKCSNTEKCRFSWIQMWCSLPHFTCELHKILVGTIWGFLLPLSTMFKKEAAIIWEYNHCKERLWPAMQPKALCEFADDIVWIPECAEVKWSEVAQLCPTLCNPIDCSLPGSSVRIKLLKAQSFAEPKISLLWALQLPPFLTREKVCPNSALNYWKWKPESLLQWAQQLLTFIFQLHFQAVTFQW